MKSLNGCFPQDFQTWLLGKACFMWCYRVGSKDQPKLVPPNSNREFDTCVRLVLLGEIWKCMCFLWYTGYLFATCED